MATAKIVDDRIDGSPSKEFFLFMLTRDIELVDAIADLFDNCVDGARRARTKGNFDGLSVRIEATKEKFRIADNCGGIPVDLARHYAFRFGRPTDMPGTIHSIGEFGIGMKRALFKMGRKFLIESSTSHSRFSVRIDVDTWEKEKDWNFHFASLSEGISVPEEKRGTVIVVTRLYDGVASEFQLENYQNLVRQKLEGKHQMSLAADLSVTFNRNPLKVVPSKLLHRSDILKPGFFENEYLKETGTPVTVQMWVGLSESEPADGGWYVYCNGRMVLQADKSRATGWGEDEVISIPRFHNQYARFRGYAFFDSDDAELLPWNTSKTAMALDSPLYQTVRQQMIYLMRPVISFLNELKREEQSVKEANATPLSDLIATAKSSELSRIRVSPTFTAPKLRQTARMREIGSISYVKPLDQIARVQKALKARSRKEIGEKTFDYFYRAECKE